MKASVLFCLVLSCHYEAYPINTELTFKNTNYSNNIDVVISDDDSDALTLNQDISCQVIIGSGSCHISTLCVLGSDGMVKKCQPYPIWIWNK